VPSFVDTNILVYAEDKDAGQKHTISRNLVLELWDSREGILSVQVLQEFFVTVTRKLEKPLPPKKANAIVRQYLTWSVVPNTGQLLLDSIALQQRASVSFWDALILQAAISAGCERLYTEDLNAGQRFGALQVINPFSRA
jgi:predicted nucleic acid-binding protein